MNTDLLLCNYNSIIPKLFSLGLLHQNIWNSAFHQNTMFFSCKKVPIPCFWQSRIQYIRFEIQNGENWAYHTGWVFKECGGCLDKKEDKVISRKYLLFSSMFLLMLLRDWILKTNPKRKCDEGEECQPREEAAIKITWWIKKSLNRIYLSQIP